MARKPVLTAASALPTSSAAGHLNIPFIDLQAQRHKLGAGIEQAIERVLAHGQFINGPEISDLEARLADWCGARHVVACASGTTALSLCLTALGAKYRDAVFVPAFTFVSPAEVIARLGCIPFFIDVDPDSFNMSPASLVRGIESAKELGLTPRGIVVIDLFGQPADYTALTDIATGHDLWILADAAQSFGGAYGDTRVGKLARMTATSFFPSKPLGCYGDGGAIFTDSDVLAAEVRSRRQHGQGEDRMTHVRIGMNGRLDTLQAAILLQKLNIFDEELIARDRIAQRYNDALRDLVPVPEIAPGRTSAWAQYTVRLRPGERAEVRSRLEKDGIPTAVYYHTALHQHAPYTGYPRDPEGLRGAEELAESVLSLPMHPYLAPDCQEMIVARFRDALGRLRGV